MRRIPLIFVLILLTLTPAYAGVFASVQGTVADPQGRNIEAAVLMLQAGSSDWRQQVETGPKGDFLFLAVPPGEYLVTASFPGMKNAQRRVLLHSGDAIRLGFVLELAGPEETVQVSAQTEITDTQTSTTQNTVDRLEIQRIPGADRTNSLAMITNLVPGAFLVHDQLHIRGGHQISWLIDGIPVPNTNVLGNVGPQFDPKDVDYLGVQRGGYEAEYGDRAFGVFNLVPRSGFERDNEAELVANYGSLNQSNDQLSFGGHTERFAYYSSLTANRTDLGLQPPDLEALHGNASGLGGFTSLIYNPTAKDQFRLVTSLRRDSYDVPNTPEQDLAGADNAEREQDAFAGFTWARTLRPGVLLTASPLFHRNRAELQDSTAGSLQPVSDRLSRYAGGNLALSAVTTKHKIRVGTLAFRQWDDQFFRLDAEKTVGSAAVEQSQKVDGFVGAAFIEDQYKVSPLLTVNTGLRITHFNGLLTETAASPRVGVALTAPRLNWVFRAFYGRFYQPPPLATLSGRLQSVAENQGLGFLPLHGEKDEQREIGFTIPLKGWAFDLVHFHTNARDFFDHEVIGNSNVFLPLNIARARLRGWEATAQSPTLFGRGHLHVAYSHMYAQGQGPVTGGLTDFEPPEPGLFFLDHDQRNTLTAGGETDLPRGAWASLNLAYGSGFLDGDGPGHMPGHTTFDMAVGKAIGERLSIRLSVLNAANSRYLVDRSNTFGGTHYNFPREVTFTVRYRFHY